jgi:phosphoenolpyruvate synthase/pyruvate phosphate dikinase
MVAAIMDGYLSLGAGVVAVRSSATMEDSAEASFAGLQDSYLGVDSADGVLDAVRRCWASLYNDESVGYRRRAGLPERDVAMGVVVQRMVSPRAAGVMFTCSPVTGDRSVVAIEGTWGLGSALVAGDVSPDGFTVSKVTGEITGRRVGAKLRIHTFIPNVRGISDQVMSADLRGRPCLTDDQARSLARLAGQVEDHFGGAQESREDGGAEEAVEPSRAEAPCGVGNPGGHAVRAPLPGTFYRAPRPGAAAFVEVGRRVGSQDVVGIVETMKLMNSVHAGVAGTVVEICVGNGDPVALGGTLMRIEADS